MHKLSLLNFIDIGTDDFPPSVLEKKQHIIKTWRRACPSLSLITLGEHIFELAEFREFLEHGKHESLHTFLSE